LSGQGQFPLGFVGYIAWIWFFCPQKTKFESHSRQLALQQSIPFIMKNSTFVFFLLLFLLNSCTSHIYFVRHAEKLDESEDPPLTQAGSQRANDLKDRLLNAGIDSIFATRYIRVQKTVEPLATALGEPISTYGTDTTYQFAQALKKIKGKDIVVAGHSNTIPEMILLLTGDSVTIGHQDYDNLFIVKMQWGIFGKKSRLTKETFGAESP
jgi:phosphohistidine phosphatase SixA